MSDYKQSPHYATATAQEKVWFDIYHDSRDIQAATYGAYRVSNDESARAYGKTVMARKHIMALIDEFCTPQVALPTLEDLKRLYVEIANDPNSSPRDKLSALNSYERVCGFGNNKKNAQPDPQDVYDPLDDLTD